MEEWIILVPDFVTTYLVVAEAQLVGECESATPKLFWESRETTLVFTNSKVALVLRSRLMSWQTQF